MSEQNGKEVVKELRDAVASVLASMEFSANAAILPKTFLPRFLELEDALDKADEFLKGETK